MNSINFLFVVDILKIHAAQLKAFGGAEGIRDRGGLEAAIAQPQQTWGGEYVYSSVFEMASVYAYHLAESQAFVDGNKRTALHAAIVFLAINGYLMEKSDMRLYDAMIAIAKKTMTKEELADLFRELVIDGQEKI